MTTKITATALTLLAALALTGCSSTAKPSADPNLGGYLSGDVITETQACVIDRNPRDGLVSYPMADGSRVLVILDDERPQNVLDDFAVQGGTVAEFVDGNLPTWTSDIGVAVGVVSTLTDSCLTPTITPTPTDTLVDVPENAEAGDALTEEQAREVNTDASDGLIAYKLSDGSYVLIREGEALPANVVADVEVRAEVAVPAVSGDALQDGSNRIAIDGADRFANQLEREVGKNVLMVFQIIGFEPNEDPSAASLRWKIRNNVNQTYPTINGETLDEAVARAEGIVAGFENPEEWVVIVVR